MSYDEPHDRMTDRTERQQPTTGTGGKRMSNRDNNNRDRLAEIKEALVDAAKDSAESILLCVKNTNPRRPVKSAGYWIYWFALGGFLSSIGFWALGLVFGLFGVSRVSSTAPESFRNGVQNSSYIVKGADAIRQGVGTTTNVMFSEEDARQNQNGWQQGLPVSIQDPQLPYQSYQNPYTYGIDANANSAPINPYQSGN